MKAMILAAGFGTRLFPLTIDRTKPAIPFLGKPLVGYVAEYVAKYGFKDVVVNLHHQPDSVQKALGNGEDFGVKIHYTHEEPKILGTAGALDNARHLLEDETFLTANGKIITDVDIDAALETHKQTGALATMILKPNYGYEKFSEVFVKDGVIKGFGGFPNPNSNYEGKNQKPLMFTGIQIFEPRVFDYIPKGIYSDIVPSFYLPAIKNGEIISAHVAKGKWFELSTIQRYLDISLYMRNEIPDKNILGSNLSKAEGAIIKDSIIWDNVTIEKNASLYRTVLGDDVTIKAGESYDNVAIVKAKMLDHYEEIPEKAIKGKIIGENYVVPLNQ